MKSFPIIRVVTKLLIPYILLFALYVQFHGDFGPGGGFQAGVILASALILYGLVFGVPAAQKVAPPWLVEKLIALGVLVFAGTGVATMLLGENFLDYDALEHHFRAKENDDQVAPRQKPDHPQHEKNRAGHEQVESREMGKRFRHEVRG